MFSDRSLLEPVMPILTKHLDNEYNSLLNVFKDIITANDENKDFFSSPTEYLKKANALTMDRIQLPDGTFVPTIDDKVLTETMRRARELYFGKKITLDDIKSTVVDTERSTSYYRSTSESTSSKRESTVWEYSSSTRTSDVWHHTERSTGIHREGGNILIIDGFDIGPLANPKIFAKIGFVNPNSIEDNPTREEFDELKNYVNESITRIEKQLDRTSSAE